MGWVERGPRGRKEKAEEEEVDLLEVFFYHIYEFLSPVANCVPVVASVVDDPVVPVNFVPIFPIVFVPASSVSS